MHQGKKHGKTVDLPQADSEEILTLSTVTRTQLIVVIDNVIKVVVLHKLCYTTGMCLCCAQGDALRNFLIAVA
jgi:hypothetical protein